MKSLKFTITLASPRGALGNEDCVESFDFLHAPNADVAYARAVAKWPQHDVRRVTTTHWTLESEMAPKEGAISTSVLLSAPP
jgi:hypothetical protein